VQLASDQVHIAISIWTKVSAYESVKHTLEHSRTIYIPSSKWRPQISTVEFHELNVQVLNVTFQISGMFTKWEFLPLYLHTLNLTNQHPMTKALVVKTKITRDIKWPQLNCTWSRVRSFDWTKSTPKGTGLQLIRFEIHSLTSSPS